MITTDFTTNQTILHKIIIFVTVNFFAALHAQIFPSNNLHPKHTGVKGTRVPLEYTYKSALH